MKSSKSEITTFIMFVAIIMAFLILLGIIMLNNGRLITDTERDFMPVSDVTDYSSETVTDGNAPAGIRQLYTWRLDGKLPNDASLVFYIIHQYAEVYLDGECIYSLSLASDTNIGTSPASNWVIIPFSEDDAGKTVKIVITPVYRSASEFVPQFKLGSFYLIYKSAISSDIIKIILAGLCIFIGVVLFIFGFSANIIKKLTTRDLMILGIFSVLLGTWKITDTQIAAFWYKNSSFAMGYITIAVLFLLVAVLFYYIDAKSPSSFKKPYKIADILASAVVLTVFICQIGGYSDLRENLFIAHIMIIALIIFELTMEILYIRSNRNVKILPAMDFLVFNSCGAFADIIIWYTTGSSDNAVFTLVTFVLYEIHVFIQRSRKHSKMAYIDAQTGLMNKNRFIEVMNECSGTKIGIIMLDINSLKGVNDKFGHDAGDILIYNFSNILRSSVPPGNTICRWGGDEFTIVLPDSERSAIEVIIEKISSAVEMYNSSSAENGKISFSAGYALADDYPKLNNMELLKIADSMMYKNKSKYYSSNDTKR